MSSDERTRGKRRVNSCDNFAIEINVAEERLTTDVAAFVESLTVVAALRRGLAPSIWTAPALRKKAEHVGRGTTARMANALVIAADE